jgi:thiamine monophosphate synthase
MDEETLLEAALQLREQYPDDEEFAAAMERLQALAQGEGEPPTSESEP